jgi:hypothetical protein
MTEHRRRSPPPWDIEDANEAWVVRDHNGHALAYCYYEQEPGRRSGDWPPQTGWPPQTRCCCVSSRCRRLQVGGRLKSASVQAFDSQLARNT